MAVLELHQHIDVAVGPEVVAKRRAEDREMLDVIAAAEDRQCLPIDGQMRTHRAIGMSIENADSTNAAISRW
jgi:uncharacterized iron-regulated protein